MKKTTICTTCGTQYPMSDQHPERCLICEDERQFVGHSGQSWTTLARLNEEHRNVLNELEPGVTEIVTEPKYGIGQRALLLETPHGNVLWDCVSVLDDATVASIEARGGISALAMSHPHMYGSMVEWSHAFGGAPIHLHAANEKWVMRPDPVVKYWDGESFPINDSVTLHRTGGHFTGSTILHWSEGAQGRGVLFTSDSLHVTYDRRFVAFMYSYPNYIPLAPQAVDHIEAVVQKLRFDRIYSHFPGLVIESDARAAVQRSVQRHKKAMAYGTPNAA